MQRNVELFAIGISAFSGTLGDALRALSRNPTPAAPVSPAEHFFWGRRQWAQPSRVYHF